MKKLRTIFDIAWVELQTLFYSPIAWLILIIFTFQCAMVFSGSMEGYARNQELGYRLWNVTLGAFSGFRGLFTEVQNYLYLYIPLLTMGLVSREYGSGSIKLLYSSPLSNTQIILGKFLSMMIYGLVLLLILSVFVVFGLITIEHVERNVILSGLLGVYLLICAYSAIGLFMSSLTSYQVVAAIGTFAILAVLNFVGGMWQDIEFVRDITYWLSIQGRASEMVGGLICSEDVLYFLIVISLFILLTIIRLQAKRSKLRFSMTVGKYVTVLVGAMLLGYVSSRPKMMTFYDTTSTKMRTLTPNSQEIIRQLDGGLTVTTFVNILGEYYWEGLPTNVNTDLKRFRQYWRFKPEIKFKYVYYYDKTNSPSMDQRFPGLTDRERMKKLCEIHRLDTNMFLSPEELKKRIDLDDEKNNGFVRLLERSSGEKTFLRIFDDSRRHPDESQISAAFKRVAMELPVVGFLTGHGERDCIREGDKDYNRFAQDKSFRYSLINNGFDFIQLTLDQDVPEKVKILVIADMRQPLNPEEQLYLDRYIARGGNLLIAAEPRRQEVMNPLVEAFGVRFLPGQIVRPTRDYQADFIVARPTAEARKFSYILDQMARFKAVATMPGSVGMTYSTDKGFNVVPLLATDSTGCWNELETTDFVDDTVSMNPAIGEVEKAWPTMLALSRQIGGKEQKIIVLADADCIGNGEISIGRKNVEAANYSLVTASFFWMSDEEVPIDVRRPDGPDRKVRLSLNCAETWKWVFMGGIPVALLAIFLFIWIRRRGR